MKLKDLIDQYPQLNKEYFFKWYCRQNSQAFELNDTISRTLMYLTYKKAYEILKSIQPDIDTSMSIIISFIEDEENLDNHGYFDVRGFNLNENTLEVIQLKPLSQWLNMEISPGTLKMFEDKSEIIVHCLYEMSFEGYETEISISPQELQKEMNNEN